MNYDAELHRYDGVFRRAAGIQPHDQVLDVGCGGGRTTRDAARATGPGSAFGVDVSASAIARARELARVEGPSNVAFEQADAQVHRFAPERFDVAISRFGTMFFEDPVAAFANIGRALRPGGRLVMLVWQAGARNEWDVVIRRCLEAVPAGGPDPFSLADSAAVTQILQHAGFADIAVEDVHEPVFYGPDVAAALEWVRGFAVLKQLDPPASARTLGRLRAALAAHLSGDGVWLDSRAWLVTARRPR